MCSRYILYICILFMLFKVFKISYHSTSDMTVSYDIPYTFLQCLHKLCLIKCIHKTTEAFAQVKKVKTTFNRHQNFERDL